jgi:hypothetical protein
MGRDLCKLRAQIAFNSDGSATLKLRRPEAKTNSHGSTTLSEGLLRFLNFSSRL